MTAGWRHEHRLPACSSMLRTSLSISIHALNATHSMSSVLGMDAPANHTSPLHVRKRRKRGNKFAGSRAPSLGGTGNSCRRIVQVAWSTKGPCAAWSVPVQRIDQHGGGPLACKHHPSLQRLLQYGYLDAHKDAAGHLLLTPVC